MFRVAPLARCFSQRRRPTVVAGGFALARLPIAQRSFATKARPSVGDYVEITDGPGKGTTTIIQKEYLSGKPFRVKGFEGYKNEDELRLLTEAPAAAVSGLDIEGLSAAGLKATLEVIYGEKVLTYGGVDAIPEVTPVQSQKCPSLNLVGAEPGKYVVIMTDPDAPSRTEPLFREFVHLVATEVPLEADGTLAVAKGNNVVPYVGCAPPYNSDLHRYIFLVYPQPGVDPAASLNKALGDRGGKKAAVAAKDAGLGDPIAYAVFVAKWDESCDALHEAIDFLPPPQYRSPKQVADQNAPRKAPGGVKFG